LGKNSGRMGHFWNRIGGWGMAVATDLATQMFGAGWMKEEDGQQMFRLEGIWWRHHPSILSVAVECACATKARHLQNGEKASFTAFYVCNTHSILWGQNILWDFSWGLKNCAILEGRRGQFSLMIL
jgi:hypothetical protein